MAAMSLVSSSSSTRCCFRSSEQRPPVNLSAASTRGFYSFNSSLSTRCCFRSCEQRPPVNQFQNRSLIVMCSQLDGNGAQTKRTVLHDLYEKGGQSPCYDNLRRPVTDLLPLIANGVIGVTSNTAIFHETVLSTTEYYAEFSELIQAGKDVEAAYWELVIKDVQDACKLFKPIYDQTDAADGYVSVEVSPMLADNTKGTIEAAKWLHKVVDRPNVYIKIPATAACVPSIKKIISLGISVDVTLIFSLARFEAVIDAYLDGLEASRLSDLSKVTSVASFFVSRVDTVVDKMLEKKGIPEALNLGGKAAVAQAALAYHLYQQKFSGRRWEALAKKGAKKQRLLWALTSVKNPAYPDTLYVAPFIGPDCVSIMPDQALQAFQAFIDNGSLMSHLIFSLVRYEAVIDAYLDGLEASRLSDLSNVTGVASFFVSRVDTVVDKMLEKNGILGALSLGGKAAVAQAALAYQLYQKKFSGPRWEALAKKGAKKQRVLWALASVKNSAHPDTPYVAPLVGPDSVSTMTDQALQAFIYDFTVSRIIDLDMSDAESIYGAIKKFGIDWSKVGTQLEVEGVDSLKESFMSLLDTLEKGAFFPVGRVKPVKFIPMLPPLTFFGSFLGRSFWRYR